MSNRNNLVSSVLPVSNCTALAAKGAALESLTVGQLGVFDALTNKAVDDTDIADAKEIFFALGVDTNNDGVVDDFRFSAGQNIQKGTVLPLTTKDYNAGTPMQVDVTGYRAECDTEYGIRVEFRNSQISRIQGFNQFSKAYMVTTPCCNPCDTAGCNSVDASVLTMLFVNAINSDVANLVTAAPIARQALTIATHGTSADYSAGDVMTEADVDAIIAFNLTATPGDEVYADLTLVSVPLSIGDWCQVNLGYHKLLETTLVVSLIAGFNCSGASTINTYPTFAEGTGANVMQKEYHASGWAGSGPYKLSEVTGTAKGNILYLTNKATNYDQTIVTSNFHSDSGWKEYSNPIETVVAFPTGACAAETAFKTIMGLFIG